MKNKTTFKKLNVWKNYSTFLYNVPVIYILLYRFFTEHMHMRDSMFFVLEYQGRNILTLRIFVRRLCRRKYLFMS